MKLWIRSQDKMTLMQVNFLYIGGTYKSEVMTDKNNILYSLGLYKTKTRALQVLDEIEKILKPKYERTFEFKGYSEQPTTIIYEMPKE